MVSAETIRKGDITVREAKECEPDYDLAIADVRKEYGTVIAVQDLNLGVRQGEFLTILGPSGSGKTTTLQMIAGFSFPTAGSIVYRGVDITYTPPHLRQIGMVFQNYALFPHMTVLDNVAFPLRMRRLSAQDAWRQASAALEMVGLGGFENRRPIQLSGGQQQRAALARALVYRPSLLLMDEPLGALDKQLRERMQVELKRIQRSLGTTIVYVTHDQQEALAMSDRIAIMADGRLHGIGTPSEIYQRPPSKFIAQFVGECNLLEGTVGSVDGSRCVVRLETGLDVMASSDRRVVQGDRVVLCLRPESIQFSSTFSNRFDATIEQAIFLGDSYRYEISIRGSSARTHLMVRRERSNTSPQSCNTPVSISWDVDSAWVIHT